LTGGEFQAAQRRGADEFAVHKDFRARDGSGVEVEEAGQWLECDGKGLGLCFAYFQWRDEVVVAFCTHRDVDLALTDQVAGTDAQGHAPFHLHFGAEWCDVEEYRAGGQHEPASACEDGKRGTDGHTHGAEPEGKATAFRVDRCEVDRNDGLVVSRIGRRVQAVLTHAYCPIATRVLTGWSPCRPRRWGPLRWRRCRR